MAGAIPRWCRCVSQSTGFTAAVFTPFPPRFSFVLFCFFLSISNRNRIPISSVFWPADVLLTGSHRGVPLLAMFYRVSWLECRFFFVGLPFLERYRVSASDLAKCCEKFQTPSELALSVVFHLSDCDWVVYWKIRVHSMNVLVFFFSKSFMRKTLKNRLTIIPFDFFFRVLLHRANQLGQAKKIDANIKHFQHEKKKKIQSALQWTERRCRADESALHLLF